jgi:hypothetical protein
MSRQLLAALGVAIALGTVYACASDETLAPSALPVRGSTISTGASHSQYDVAPTVVTIVALKRSFYLPRDLSASAFVGPEGGEITVPLSGATIVFPPGALARRTRITMTAKAGWNVAYEFAPHGIAFDAPVSVEQDLSFTAAFRMSDVAKLEAGYYQDSLRDALVDPSQSLARVSELRSVDLDLPLNPRVATFYIFHFSGYILSSGFAGGAGDTGGDEPLP